jgi:tyrosine-protein kinase Fer
LVEVASLINCTNSEYLGIQERIYNSFKNINPNEEYNDLKEKLKKLSIIFQFNENCDKENIENLQPNQLTVDNLTIDWLRQRIADLEESIKECREKQDKMKNDTNGRSLSITLPSSPLNSVVLDSENSLDLGQSR